MITSFTAYGLAGSGHPHPLIALAQRRGSTATTRAGAYRYLMANISEPELAEKLAHRFARPIGGRGREAALIRRICQMCGDPFAPGARRKRCGGDT